jgi:hypothetical protein
MMYSYATSGFGPDASFSDWHNVLPLHMRGVLTNAHGSHHTSDLCWMQLPVAQCSLRPCVYISIQTVILDALYSFYAHGSQQDRAVGVYRCRCSRSRVDVQPSLIRMKHGQWAAVLGNGYNNNGTGYAVFFVLFLDGPGSDGRGVRASTI